MIPSAKIVVWPIAPPENALIRPKSDPVSRFAVRNSGLMPGIGTWKPRRSTRRRPSVVMIRRRVSSILKSWKKEDFTDLALGLLVLLGRLGLLLALGPAGVLAARLVALVLPLGI